jgi:hypothetical protein
MRAHLEAKGEMLLFECPGCEQSHAVPVTGPKAWGWNQRLDLPTLTPSVLCRWTWGEQHEQRVCHSFVRDGRIEFLGDCTHKLAGQTVDLPEGE